MFLPIACGPVFHPLMLLIPVAVVGPVLATVGGFSIWTVTEYFSDGPFPARKAQAWLIAMGVSLLWAAGWVLPFLV